MENFEIRVVTQEDKEPLFNFLRKHLGENGTPLMVQLKFSETECAAVADSKVTTAFIKPDKICSVVAVDKSKNEIVGCLVGYVSEISDAQSAYDKKTPQSEKFQNLIDFNRLMFSGVREFLPVGYQGPYLFGDLSLVDPEYQRLKLYAKMLDLHFERGYKFGCKFLFGSSTSHKTQVHAQSNGVPTLRWFNYEDYYILGKQVFDFGKDSPHKSAKLVLADIEKLMTKRTMEVKSNL